MEEWNARLPTIQTSSQDQDIIDSRTLVSSIIEIMYMNTTSLAVPYSTTR
jgi:hypothetical protein